MRAALGGLISSNNNNNNGGSSSSLSDSHHHPVEADTTTSANLTLTSTNSSSSSSLFNGAADLFRSTSSLSLNLSFSSSSSSSASSQQQPPQHSQSSLPQPSTTSSKMLKTPLKAFHSILPTPTNSGAPSLSPNPPLATAPTSTNAAAAASTAATSSAATPPPPATTTTITTGPAPITADVSSLLNKSATGSTGIYQQSVFLRSQLQRIPAFSPFFQFSISGSRATKDVVHQLWETFSLGKPLCVLFNLQDIPTEFKIVEYADEEVDPDPLRKERQRAIALFIMGVNNGFVKVVATVIHLLSRFPSTVWAEDGPSVSTVHGQGSGGNASANANNAAATATAPTSSKDVERRNLVRELIETERKYCQDLEIMQSYADSLRKRDIVDADTIHRLFPALGKLTDFQRKLLIHMESTAENGIEEQDWGLCFSLHEPEFAIYDAYIANYSQALDLALAEKGTLTAASDIINPAQLPAFLIKPVQRLCRYPMLLGSMLKLTPAEHRLHASLAEGVQVVKRIADAANRALREKENEETWSSILARIKDWKGLQLDTIGPMLLDDVFAVRNDRRAHAEYHIFLFNRMFLLCRPKELQSDQAEQPQSDKEKITDRLTPGFMRSANSSSAANSVLSPTSKNVTVSLLAGGAIASRRAKTPLSIRGALYIRNILDISTETNGSHAIHLKYSDRHEIMNWTIHCRNEEQMTMWETEINRLLVVWAKQEAEIRKQAKSELKAIATNAMTNATATTTTATSATTPLGIFSPQEALDSLRSAKRPAHPYQYTFGSVPTRNRNRNGSLDLNAIRPDLLSHSRARASSVSSMASEHFDPQSGRDDTSSLGSVSTNASMVDLLADPTSVSSSRSTTETNVVAAYYDATAPPPGAVNLYSRPSSRARTTSEASKASIESEKRLNSASNQSASSRLRALPLPPQPPPPTIPQPPVPTDMDTFMRSYYSGEETRPLPAPPTSQLRQRVGQKAPAPLGRLASGDDTPSTSLTPQSTLPELPSRDLKRPLSSRKSGSMLRGPREKPYSTASPPATPPLDPPLYGSSAQRRSRSNSTLGSLPPAIENIRLLPSVKKANSYSSSNSNPARKRHGSNSSNTDSMSNFTSSEDLQDADGSPRTPSSFGEDVNKASPSKFVFAVHTRHPPAPPPRYSEATANSRPPSSRGQHTLVSSAGVNFVDYPSSGVTPKTAFHETKDRELIMSSGLSRSKTSAEPHSSSALGSAAAAAANPEREGERSHSHSRSNSSSGFGRTPATKSEPSTVIVRLHYNESKFLIKLPHSSSRVEFVEKVRRKIRLCGAAPTSVLPEHLPTTRFAPEEQVSFLDENYRFAKLTSNEDFLAAWKSVTRPRRDPEDTGVFILAVGSAGHLDYGRK